MSSSVDHVPGIATGDKGGQWFPMGDNRSRVGLRPGPHRTCQDREACIG